MTARIYVTQLVPEPALEALHRVGTVDMNPEANRVLTDEELILAVKAHDYLVCTVANRIDAKLMDANAGLKVIANIAVGYDNVDVAAATARRIPVTNTPEVLTETTADLTFGLLIAVARLIATGDRMIRDGQFPRWGPMVMLGADVHGKTLGIIGFGRIGRAVARRGRGFGMRIIYSDDKRAEASLEAEPGAQELPLEELLQQADFVCLHTPASAATFHLIGERQLALMKSSAFLVNTSRGTVIDEIALAAALKDRRIAGAGLDVFENEPALTPGLAELDNVVLTPHIGSATLETRTQMALIAASNVAAVASGERAPTAVNPEIYGERA